MLTVLTLFVILFDSVLSNSDSFPVYWNIASKVCYERKIDIPLKYSGIKHNIGHEFFGDQIVIFYEYKFGYFPYYNGSNASDPINGGLPQNCPIDKHLTRVSEQIREKIPREDFSGIAVIDFEEWRPLFKLNWGKKAVYKKESIRLVRERHPTLSHKSAKMMAELEFDAAAKKIFLLTIGLARELRPNARWGFYGFPYCNYDAGHSSTNIQCNENFKQHNNDMSFIFEASTALFPSIYLSFKGTIDQNYRYIQAIMTESARIARLQNPVLDIYPYSKFEYDPYSAPDKFYVKKDLCNSVKQAADLGARGIVIWSTSKKMKERCNLLAEYVRNTFGPTLAVIRKRAQRCREERCSGHGQCVLPKVASQCTFRMRPEDYICKCDPYFTGRRCSLYKHSRNTGIPATVATYQKKRRKSRRRRIKKIHFFKVYGEAKSRGEDDQAAQENTVIVGATTTTPSSEIVDEDGLLSSSNEITTTLSELPASVKYTMTLEAVSTPTVLTTSDPVFQLTPITLEF
ncbi:hypothetical protein KIN20_033203 [Parelaphostrongylus tenuis]|uniref:Hyaluronidase n=1 Tax=Parelaphostrongylus tenuis TaxID=148309 RepID=A0AAD5WIL4_PARTN|nr:hypothetical protein KIN20_033203 [Parelaphostrongylus tenuis]